jgi:lysophospholipase L1-like esterase
MWRSAIRSLTVTGPAHHSTATYRYVNRLYVNYQPTLGADELLNRSQPGATSTSLKDGGQLTTALADINAASDTKAVTIDIGGNDYLTGKCTTNWDAPSTCPYRANLASILSQLKAALAADPGDERFAVMAYYNPGVGLSSEGEFDLARLGANLVIGLSDTGADVGLNDVIYQEAARLGIQVADPSAAFKASGQAFMADRVHPNDAGHAAIAAAFCAVDPPLACTLEPPPPPPPPLPPDTTLMGKAKASKTQEQYGRQIVVRVRVKAAERLTAEARGKIKLNPTYKLKRKTAEVPSAHTKTLKLKPKRKTAKRIIAALKRGERATAKLRMRLTDVAGNRETERLRVRLKR